MPFPLITECLTPWCARRHLEGDRAVEGGDLDLGAQHRLRVGDGHLTVRSSPRRPNTGWCATCVLMRRSPGRAAVATRCALAFEPDRPSRLDTRRHPNLDGPRARPLSRCRGTGRKPARSTSPSRGIAGRERRRRTPLGSGRRFPNRDRSGTRSPSVPGSAPEPWHRLQVASPRTVTAVSTPRTASSKVRCRLGGRRPAPRCGVVVRPRDPPKRSPSPPIPPKRSERSSTRTLWPPAYAPDPPNPRNPPLSTMVRTSSYSLRCSGSESVAYASETSLNLSSAFSSPWLASG